MEIATSIGWHEFERLRSAVRACQDALQPHFNGRISPLHIKTLIRAGSTFGHATARRAARLATPIHPSVALAMRALRFTDCRQIQSHATTTMTTARPVIHMCALPSHAKTPPAAVAATTGSASGSTQHALHASTAAPAVVSAVPVAPLAFMVLGGVVQAPQQESESSIAWGP